MLGRSRRFISWVLVVPVLTAAVLVATTSLAGATPASNELEFRAAFANDATVDLTSDITLTCANGGLATRGAGADVTINGGGHTIQQTCANTAGLQNTREGSDPTLNGVTNPRGGAGARLGSGDRAPPPSTVTSHPRRGGRP